MKTIAILFTFCIFEGIGVCDEDISSSEGSEEYTAESYNKQPLIKIKSNSNINVHDIKGTHEEETYTVYSPRDNAEASNIMNIKYENYDDLIMQEKSEENSEDEKQATLKDTDVTQEDNVDYTKFIMNSEKKLLNSQEKDENVNTKPMISNSNSIEELIQQSNEKEHYIDPNYEAEKARGSISELFGTNPHFSHPSEYKDFGRRFVPQYPYAEKLPLKQVNAKETMDQILDQREKEMAEHRLTPKRAKPELVLAIAKESAILEASKPVNPTKDLIKKNILRTGNYWNGVWKEDINPDILRNHDNNYRGLITEKDSLPKLSPVRVKIAPESGLYKLVSKLKQLSSRLLYIVNT